MENELDVIRRGNTPLQHRHQSTLHHIIRLDQQSIRALAEAPQLVKLTVSKPRKLSRGNAIRRFRNADPIIADPKPKCLSHVNQLGVILLIGFSGWMNRYQTDIFTSTIRKRTQAQLKKLVRIEIYRKRRLRGVTAEMAMGSACAHFKL